MATNARQEQGKKMDYRKVNFDVTEIAPDAPEGEWMGKIPMGKCKVQPTKEDRYPMLIVPVRLESTEEEDSKYEKALGVELPTMIVFFDDEKARAARLTKLRLRQLCEAADVDLDVIPKRIGEDPENELGPLIRELEGKTFPVWTVLETRKDTGEVVTELRFQNPKKTLTSAGDDEDDEDDDSGEDRRSRRSNSRSTGRKKAAPKKARKSSRR